MQTRKLLFANKNSENVRSWSNLACLDAETAMVGQRVRPEPVSCISARESLASLCRNVLAASDKPSSEKYQRGTYLKVSKRLSAYSDGRFGRAEVTILSGLKVRGLSAFGTGGWGAGGD